MKRIAAILARMGLPSAIARRAAPWVALIAVFALLWLLWGVSAPIRAGLDWFNDRDAVVDDRRKANLEAVREQVKADAKAAEQRVADVITQLEQERAYADAITHPRAADSDDPDVRLACEQLRRAGQDTSHLPSCGGR